MLYIFSFVLIFFCLVLLYLWPLVYRFLGAKWGLRVFTGLYCFLSICVGGSGVQLLDLTLTRLLFLFVIFLLYGGDGRGLEKYCLSFY